MVETIFNVIHRVVNVNMICGWSDIVVTPNEMKVTRYRYYSNLNPNVSQEMVSVQISELFG